MVTHLMLVGRGPWSGWTRRFRIARAALALPGRDSFRMLNLLDAGTAGRRGFAIQRCALRHCF
jgi:hypothetical protein